MENHYMIRAKKILTVSHKGTIHDGALIIKDGKILNVTPWKDQLPTKLPVYDYRDFIITPGLIDCHTHLLEFAPSSLYPVTHHSHFLAAKAILFNALSSGITALGEHICGHPKSSFSIEDYREFVRTIPMDISFAATSISIGFDQLAHFTSVTGSKPVRKEDLIDSTIVTKMAIQNDFPGENLFINATPANFTADEVPRAGEVIYTEQELKRIVKIFHQLKQQIGVHVAGDSEIKMALRAGVDVLHHAHGISDQVIKEVQESGASVVATPMGGTHLKPNSPEEIVKMIQHNIRVSIATDAYLPPYPEAEWLPFTDQKLRGPEILMQIANPAMTLMKVHGYDDNEILALITRNPAYMLRKANQFGMLLPGMKANFLITNGIPGLEITDIHDIKQVYFQGKKVIDRLT